MESPITEIVNTDGAFWFTIISIGALLFLSAFFSGSETALTAASRGKLRTLADKGSLGAASALKVTEDSERLIGTVLLGNNLVNILAAALATSLFTRLFGDSGVALATLVMTLLVLVFAEVMPKTYAITNPETAATRVSPIISMFVLFLAPIITAIRWFVRLLLRLFGVAIDPDSSILAVHDEIAGTIALGHSEGAVHKADRDRLLGALDLRHREVEEIMLHRQDIEMLNADDAPADILSQCLGSSHTRLPVFRGEPENIIGVVHAKDLLRAVHSMKADKIGDFKVLDVAMKPYFVPETTTLDDQMREFLRRRAHFALVVDEYGALQGLITLEDILEEIVGEITDEHDAETDQNVKRSEDGNMIVEGSMTIRDLNRATDWSLPDDYANTVAGLVIHESQSIPNVGQVFSFHGYRFEVLERVNNRITKLKIRPLLRRGVSAP
ncbi:MAG: HlyC/CorC family transporter [Rhodobacteraceae bacterium]|nr:HlyC/CorC family transporter [Paracoccaceae bacterium]